MRAELGRGGGGGRRGEREIRGVGWRRGAGGGGGGGGKCGPSLQSEGHVPPPPPCKGTPPHSPQSKGHPAPLHSSRKGAQASAMPFRKKAPLWRFFGGAGCFFASFFFTRFFFFLVFLFAVATPQPCSLVPPLRGGSAMRPPLRCGAATRVHSSVLPVRPPSQPLCNSTIRRTKL